MFFINIRNLYSLRVLYKSWQVRRIVGEFFFFRWLVNQFVTTIRSTVHSSEQFIGTELWFLSYWRTVKSLWILDSDHRNRSRIKIVTHYRQKGPIIGTRVKTLISYVYNKSSILAKVNRLTHALVEKFTELPELKTTNKT